jgi:farnesyl-diphosphate farnesyltransferase
MTDVDDLLRKTSRTFALAIPMLPSPTREEVGVAYLLFRIIDTFEDGALWPPARRIETIKDFLALLDAPDPVGAKRLAARCSSDPPVDHEGYLELLREIPLVLGALEGLSEASRELIRSHVKRSADGMAEVVSRSGNDGELQLEGMDELRQYCYVVAGVVGEMLTELFLLDRPSLAGVADFLRERSRLFGEGLQLVNILKDSAADESEGRVYVSASERPQAMALAQADLLAASEYTLALQRQGAEHGLVAFNALLVRLALGTLAVLRDRGPGAKLSRVEVAGIIATVMGDVYSGRPVLPVADAELDLPAAV